MILIMKSNLGEITESDEMLPLWFESDNLPYN